MEELNLSDRLRLIAGLIKKGSKVADIGTDHGYPNERQLATWLGLTLSQYSSSGKSTLGRITKAGDTYLRILLVQGGVRF